MTITPIYAGLLTLVFVALSVRVIGGRRMAGVGLGDGGNRLLLRKTRAHGNFAEYVPFALILMALAELQAGPGWVVHLLRTTCWASSFLRGGRSTPMVSAESRKSPAVASSAWR